MKLTFEQIISATNGAVRYRQNDSGLELHRFTRGQEEFFYQPHPLFCKESFFDGYFGRNCRATAGITLDFISDTVAFSIKFSRAECLKLIKPRPQMFDLYVDNKFVQSYNLSDEIIYRASGQKQRFTLYFPCYGFGDVSSVELKDATVFEPVKKQTDILFMGDSITQGAWAIHPSHTYAMYVSRMLDVGILNQGNSGFVYDSRSIEKVCEPKIVVTAYGINDFMRKTLQVLEKDTAEFIQKIKSVYPNSKIVSVLPLWTVWDADENFKKDERNCLKNIYEKYSDYVIDGHDMIPFDEKYLSDEVHPNDEGMKLYGDNLAEKINSILKNR